MSNDLNKIAYDSLEFVLSRAKNHGEVAAVIGIMSYTLAAVSMGLVAQNVLDFKTGEENQ